MKHEICDACETVAHCSAKGCIPMVPVEKAPLRIEVRPQAAVVFDLPQIVEHRFPSGVGITE